MGSRMYKGVFNSDELKCSRLGQSGPLVFMLHGYGLGPLEFHKLTALLSPSCRLVIPNMHPLFSSEKPMSFSQHVEFLGHWISELNAQREKFFLVGSSYGGALSWGLRSHYQGLIEGHILINPMPLDPLKHFRSAQLRLLFGMNMVPGALPLYLRTPPGQKILLELGDIFGLRVTKSRSLSSKKIELMTKAVQRFAWISQHENWEYWSRGQRELLIPSLLVSGQKDPLFCEKDFRTYQTMSALTEFIALEDSDHLAVRSHAPRIADIILKFISDMGAGRAPSVVRAVS